jgi:D-arabinitol dehydrogenase (NADP+)
MVSKGMQLVPGHEIVGTIAAVGKSAGDFSIGDRCVADPTVLVSPDP